MIDGPNEYVWFLVKSQFNLHTDRRYDSPSGGSILSTAPRARSKPNPQLRADYLTLDISAQGAMG